VFGTSTAHGPKHGSGMNSSGRLDGGGESAVASGVNRGQRDKEARGPGNGGGSCASEDGVGVDGGVARLKSYHESGLVRCGDQGEPAGSSLSRLENPKLARDEARGTDADGGGFVESGLDASRDAGQEEAGGALRARGAAGETSPRAVAAAGEGCDDDDGGYSEDSFAPPDGDDVVSKSRTHNDEVRDDSAAGLDGPVLDGQSTGIYQRFDAVDAIPSLLVETGRGID